MFTKEDKFGVGSDRLRVWVGTVVKLGCNDGCTTINIIKFIELKNKVRITRLKIL